MSKVEGYVCGKTEPLILHCKEKGKIMTRLPSGAVFVAPLDGDIGLTCPGFEMKLIGEVHGEFSASNYDGLCHELLKGQGSAGPNVSI